MSCGTYAAASKQIDSNLQQLKMGSVELTLIHFDRCWGSGSLDETWKALEDARTAGKTKAIGVSNFDVNDLTSLKKSASYWPPAVNQMSTSVGYHDDKTMEYCDREKITYMAYSPLCGGSNGSSCKHGSVMHITQVQSIAKTHGVSAAQVALKWIAQHGVPLAVKADQVQYQQQDIDIFDFTLSDDDMAALDAATSPSATPGMFCRN